MKIIIAGALTLGVFVVLHIPKMKKRKELILALYAVAVIFFFCIYNFRTMELIIPSYHPTNQSLYQPEFVKSGELADAFLEELLKGRTVYTPDDSYVTDYEVGPDFDSIGSTSGNYWLYYYYHAINMWSFLDLAGADVIKDASLNDKIFSDEQKAHYKDLGSANDMLRYIFPLSPYSDEWGNAFYHYWYYSTFVGNSRVYICIEDIMDANELVVIWQHEPVHDTESYYIAAKEYYDRVIVTQAK